MRILFLLGLLATADGACAADQVWVGRAVSRTFGGRTNAIRLQFDVQRENSPTVFAVGIGRYLCTPGTLPCWMGRGLLTFQLFWTARLEGIAQTRRGRECYFIIPVVSGIDPPRGTRVAGTYTCGSERAGTVDEGRFRVKRRR